MLLSIVTLRLCTVSVLWLSRRSYIADIGHACACADAITIVTGVGNIVFTVMVLYCCLFFSPVVTTEKSLRVQANHMLSLLGYLAPGTSTVFVVVVVLLSVDVGIVCVCVLFCCYQYRKHQRRLRDDCS